MLINKKVLSVLKGCAKSEKDINTVLTGVYIKENESGYVAEATDGRIAFRLCTKKADQANYPDVYEKSETFINAIIPPDFLSSELKKIKNSKRTILVNQTNILLEQENGEDGKASKIRSTYADINTTTKNEVHTIQDEFPDTQQVYDLCLDPVVRFSVSAEKLKTICEAFIQKIGKNEESGAMIEIELFGNKQPILFREGGELQKELTALLMPMVSETTHFPQKI